MLTTSLPLLPPPASSLLPPLHHRPNADSTNHNDGQHTLSAQQQRRAKQNPHGTQPLSQLARLAHDERVIAQRKLAIQTYGYSWIKPAGCSKTMLGRREEEIEREEAEKQLREVEMQERGQAEMEEAQRLAQLDEQRARETRGEDVGDGERDLDEEVPDMDAPEEYDDEESEQDEDEEDEVDLDNDIPEADNSWAYNTNRDPDTGSESEAPWQPPQVRFPAQPRTNIPGNRLESQSSPQEAVNAEQSMLDDNYQGQGQGRDLDDDVPDMDDSGQDLDDEVPDADDDGRWEHTDTELEESDMDISIMPPGAAVRLSLPPPSSNMNQRSRRHISRQSAAPESENINSGMRRTSGNIQPPMPPPGLPAATSRGLAQAQQPPHFTPDQFGSDFSVSALISTGATDMSSAAAQQGARSWLDPASARRNLFGASRAAHVQPSGASRTISRSNRPQTQNEPNVAGGNVSRQVSSGGLFTPSPQQQNMQRGQQGTFFNEPQSRTRSGRVTGRARGGRAS